MRIAVISTPIFRLGNTGTAGYSGLEHLAWLTAKGLAEKGHQVTLVAPDGSACPGVTIIPVGPERMTDEGTAYGRYWKHLLQVDCVIDETWSKQSYLLKMEGRLQCPILGVCHAPISTMYQSLPPVEKPCFVCISHDQAAHFEALHGRQAKVVYNGVDGEHFYRPMALPKTGRYLFLARFSTIKGPALAIEACKMVGAGLDLVGDTSITNEPEYLAKCKAMADGKQIRIIGPCSRSETVGWYSRSKCLLHCVRDFREPFGLAPVEAQLCGIPVCSWRNGAMKETIKHGVTGFLVDSVSEMAGLIREGAVDSLKPSDCREWASQFSISRMVNGYDNLVKEAVETGGW